MHLTHFQFLARRASWLILIAALWARPAAAQSDYNPDWARNFRIGVLAGFNIKSDFRFSGSGFGISSSRPGDTGTPGVDHFYDDGYVRVDNFGNSGGYTTYFGYQDRDAQLSGNTLMFHSSSSFSTSAADVTKDAGLSVGIDMAYGGNLWYWKKFRFGYEIGFGFLPISVSDNRDLPGSVIQSTFSFQVPSGVALQPGAYNGGPDGFGDVPSIKDLASLVGTSTNGNATITGSRQLDAMLYTLRLGPSVFWDVNDHIGLSLSLGPAIGIVSGEYKFDETIGTAHNKGRFSSTEFTYGGYVSGALTYHVVENGDFYIGAQYMPLGSVTFSKGGRSANLNLEGSIFVSAGINWPF